MGSILIAMPKRNDANSIAEMLAANGLMMDTYICQNAADVLRNASNLDYGVVICTKNLGDMGYMELSVYLPKFFGILLLTKDAGLECRDNTVRLMMPFKPRELISSIEMMSSGYVRQIRKKKDIPIKKSMAERKVIDKAKAVLMERNGMSEPEAFRYIQKTSMDCGRSLSESAQMILMMTGDALL